MKHIGRQSGRKGWRLRCLTDKPVKNAVVPGLLSPLPRVKMKEEGK